MMQIEPFKLERYFAKYEFNVKYLLSSSDCDGFSMQYVLDAAEQGEQRLWDNLTLGYTDSLGHPLLREAISRHYNTVTLDDVFVLSPGEANFILMNLVLSAGDEVVCMRPAYQSLYQVARSIGCKLVFWEPNDQGGYNVDDLAQLVSVRTKMLIVNFPHNPTGFYPTREELDRLIQIVRRNNTFVFSDEMYHKLVHDKSNLNDSLVDLYENCICLWGTAKSFGLAGLRIGWVVSHNRELLQKMQSYKDYFTICNSAPAEVLTMIALNNSEKFIEVNLDKIRKNKKHFAEFVSRHPENFPSYKEPRAGSTALVEVNIGKPTLEYAEEIVKRTGIMLVPAEMFEYGEKHFRIGFGRSNMPEALSAWESVL
jgi:aspartate/methionine/tyrosine aminotransferase